MLQQPSCYDLRIGTVFVHIVTVRLVKRPESKGKLRYRQLTSLETYSILRVLLELKRSYQWSVSRKVLIRPGP